MVVLVVVLSVVVPTADHLAAVPIVADSVVALAEAVRSAEARMVAVLTVVDTPAEAAEWVDTDNSENKFPDFSIRHPLNIAH